MGASRSRTAHHLYGIAAVIFVTVGTQLPFDRLIRAVDDTLDATPTLGEALFQIGKGGYEPRNGHWQRVLTPPEFKAVMTKATVVISHAGIGTILSSRKYGLPVVMMPRRADMSEHRNDHQTATARSLGHLSGVYVAWDEVELVRLLASPLTPPSRAADNASRQRLKDALAGMIRASL